MFDEINLQKTKEYKTRDNRMAIVAGTCDHIIDGISFGYYGYIEEPDMNGDDKHEMTAFLWRAGGSTRTCGDCEMSADIVDFWISEEEPTLDTSPKVDWDKYPDCIKFIARDESGSWYGYTHKPDKDDECFYNNDVEPFSMTTRINDDDAPEFDGEWEDSLCVRPALSRKLRAKSRWPSRGIRSHKVTTWSQWITAERGGHICTSRVPTAPEV